MKNSLPLQTAADLAGSTSLGEMATREGFTPSTYAIALADYLRDGELPGDLQRERIAALVGLGRNADVATADELAHHYVLLEALLQRFAVESVKALTKDAPRAAHVSETYLNASIKAQRAALACLSALKAIRSTPSPTTTRPSSVAMLDIVHCDRADR